MTDKIALVILLVFSTLAVGEDSLPQTVDEAASILIQHLKTEEKEEIVSKTRRDLLTYHHGWGTGIRNDFGLWKGNLRLLNDCGGKTHPDVCSQIIIERVWEKLRSSYPKKYIRSIDRINSLLRKIKISAYLEKKAGAIEYVNFLNSEIKKSQYSGEFTLSAACISSDYRLKNFYHKNVKTLHKALQYFRVQRVAKIKIEPNRILIVPLRACK